MKRCLDLFCGRFGWSKAFAARGWQCVGVDLVAPPEVPDGCTFVQGDILELRYSDSLGFYWPHGLILGFFDFVCASSPCEQFSIHGMKHFHPNPPFPELGIKLFAHTRELCEVAGVPYVMENVRAAQKFVGKAVHHAGSFHLWGSAVPPLMPQGIRKGMRLGTGGFTGVSPNGIPQPGRRFALMTAEEKKAARKTDPMLSVGSTSVARMLATAAVATIPPELASAVVNYAEAILGSEAEGLTR